MTKVALITGGSKGIGYGIAVALAKRNYSIILVARTEEDLKKSAEELTEEYGAKVTYVPADLSSGASYELILSHVEKEYGKLDLLVNNAGDFRQIPRTDADGKVRDTPHEIATDTEALFFVNAIPPSVLSHTMRSLQLKSANPKQIDVLSSAALEIFSGNNPYGPTKVAHERISLSVTAETAGRIKTYRIYPSNTDTRIVKHFDVPKLTPEQVGEEIVDVMHEENATDIYLKMGSKGTIRAVGILEYEKLITTREDGSKQLDGLNLVEEHRKLLSAKILPIVRNAK